ncbi:flavohemoglobin expression-modulating QEGLA motif protein [Pseudomonadota bacterium]
MDKAETKRSGNKLISEIGHLLSENKPVRRKLHETGRLHIDRQLPFLCVHRQLSSDDLGTANLMFGQGSYLKTTAEASQQSEISELVYDIAKVQSEIFGAFLIIELWSDNSPCEDENIPAFHLMIPKKHGIKETVETLENSLPKAKLRKRNAELKTSYQEPPTPSGLEPLLTTEQCQELECTTISLGVRPVYYDSDLGDILPYALRYMRHAVTVALKKAFYSFSYYNTCYRPAHFHELGRHAMTKAVWQVDEKLTEISECFDLLLHITPINGADAWKAFERSDYKKDPVFHYRPRNVDPALLKRELYRVALEKIEDPTLANLFEAKREELDRQLTLLHDRNTPRFLHGSIQLFGYVDKELITVANKVLAHSSPLPASEELIDAEQFSEKAREEIEYYRKIDPTLSATVDIRDDISGILVSHGNFLVDRNVHVSKRRLCATLSHEIGTHVLTYHNGKQQAFKQLYAGMAGYEELQEGLAVLSEYLTGGLDLPRLKILAARVIAADSIMSGASFMDTYHLLHDMHGFKRNTAFFITMRVFRGGGYTKDMIYLRGLINLLSHIGQHDDLDILYSGKIAMEHLPLLRELHWREVLREPAITPKYLSDERAQQRMKALKEEPTLDHIIRNI